MEKINMKNKFYLPTIDFIKIELDEIITTSPDGFMLFGADIGTNDPGINWGDR